ncbi:MAG: chorismate mutase [Lentisphaeria bacterium]|nr:chorismate mutase [Lentisphaerota bacterium]MBR2625781.1 chorismate mutase [Lentisphaeria bacterium]
MENNSLETARKNIDRINRELVLLLIERMKEVDQVAAWKKANNQPVHVPAREEAIIEKVRSLAGEEFACEIETVFRAIFAASCAREERKIKHTEELS